MKHEAFTEDVIAKTHCDCILDRAKELKALISYDSGNIVKFNKTRALSAIDCIRESLTELSGYIEEQ